jgi:hypothetical protein
MPVSTLICCDLEDCEACSFESPFVSAVAGSSPPSRFKESSDELVRDDSCEYDYNVRILVSLVSRLSTLLRIRFSEAMLALL